MNNPSIILIPSYEPNDRLIDLIHNLTLEGFEKILVVNDGSGDEYTPIFDSLIKYENVILLSHEKNMGKGQALKTGFQYILDHSMQFEPFHGVITVDSDGQHLIKDIVRLSKSLTENKSGILLGVRDFSKKNVPKKSRFGNTLTSRVFKYLYDAKISDTQTGLRGMPLSELDFLISIGGSRFEYETNMLIQYIRNNKCIDEVPIETVYHNNHPTHFNPITDSIKIYRNLLGVFIKFSFVSIMSAVLDMTIFTVVLKLFFINNTASAIFYSILIARICSSLFNFTLNKKHVFHANDDTFKQITKYFCLCAIITAISIAFVQLIYFITEKEPIIIKLMVDFILYLVNFKVQQLQIFKNRRNG